MERGYSPPQHVTLLGFLEDQDQLIDRVDLVFDVLNQRPERIRDVIDQGVRDPIRRDVDIVFELLDTSSDVLRVRRATEVELLRESELVSGVSRMIGRD